MLSQRRALVCMGLCTCHIWFLCALHGFVSALSEHIDTRSCTHVPTHIQARAHAESNRPIRHSQCSNSLITFSTLANPPAFHPSCNSPKEKDSFHTANGYRKGNIFILIIRSTQGFIWYSPTLCPFIALNDGRYLKREYRRRGRENIHCRSVRSLQSTRGRGKERAINF